MSDGEISHGGMKPKAAGREGGMDEGVKRGLEGLEMGGRQAEAPPGF